MRKQVMLVLIGLALTALLGACVEPAPPSLKVEPEGPLDFGSTKDELFLVIDNSGGGTLRWTVSVVGGDQWLHVAPTQGINRGTVTLTADRTNLQPDSTHTAQLTITSDGGEARRTVTLTVSPGDAPPPLDRVQDLTVTGFTVPMGMLDSQNGPTAGGRVEALALHDMVRQFDLTMTRPSRATSRAVGGGARAMRPAQGEMPSGYEAAFVLSWMSVIDADAYRVFVAEDDGTWTPVADLAVDELEYDDDGYAVHVVPGNFHVGEMRTFSVQAFSTTGEDGAMSEPDRGVIIAPARLVSPGADSTVTGKPRFVWEEHPEGTAYGVYVAQGQLDQHVWHVVIDGGVTEVHYPGDDPYALPSLAPGDYLWYIAASGPVIDGKTAALAVSADWDFVVMEDDD